MFRSLKGHKAHPGPVMPIPQFRFKAEAVRHRESGDWRRLGGKVPTAFPVAGQLEIHESLYRRIRKLRLSEWTLIGSAPEFFPLRVLQNAKAIKSLVIPLSMILCACLTMDYRAERTKPLENRLCQRCADA